ncbi:hypothetical protein [Rhodopseudomonas palustris]|uniref:Uncharacterized protein n=1 Tax=Rhodopseudomonas palustris TaxID=1076 RepID=A0A418V448_RHOPL|nr:hypothetical protein [Rhodopseudomonas palustris]RJF70888.1 hypothetical protein D4Q52_14765 [Rhodopseudomonas palustris]
MITRFASDVGRLFGAITADAFWSVATSAPVLVAIGVLAAAAFAVARVPMLGRLLPPLGEFQALAAAVQLIAVAALIFLIGFRTADQRAELRRLGDELAFKAMQLKNASATAADAERLRRDAEATARQAKGKLDEYCAKFGCGDDHKPPASPAVRIVRRCDPPAGYFDWLHQLQRRRSAAGRG